MAGFSDLPVEILLRIFQFYLEDNNQRDLLKNLAKVCTLWRDLCQDKDFWVKFDGTVSYNNMKSLNSKGYFSSTKEFTVSDVKCFPDEDAVKLFCRIRGLEVLNLSRVEHLSKSTFMILRDSDLKLKEIQIGNPKLSGKEPILKYLDFALFFSIKGAGLTTIKLSHFNVKNPRQFLELLAESCPNLEHLNFTNNVCTSGNFPLACFQSFCPKLRVLHLDYNIGIGNMGWCSTGFPNLEVFTYNDLDTISHIRDKDLHNILFNSPNLTFLSLINCSISVESLCSLPANSLKYLFLSRSKVVNSDNLSDVFRKWSNTLKQVSISYCSNMSVNRAVVILSTLPTEPPIEFLDLSYTQIRSNIVKTMLEKCKKIQMLNLTACRSLPRGLKKNYSGETELRVLFEKLQTSAYDDSTDEEMPM